jgi:hypothetical protein
LVRNLHAKGETPDFVTQITFAQMRMAAERQHGKKKAPRRVPFYVADFLA